MSEAFETSAEPHRFMKRRRKGMYWMTEAPVQMVWKPCTARVRVRARARARARVRARVRVRV